MPTYQYRCEECEKTFERTETISEHEVAKPKCPTCGSKKVSVVPGRVGDIKEELKAHRIRSNRLRLLRFGTKPTNSMRRRDVSNSPQADKRTGFRYWALLQHWAAEGLRGSASAVWLLVSIVAGR